MLKIIGCIITILTCAAIGFEKGRELDYHRKELEEIQRIFMLIYTELNYMKTPFGELFFKLQNKTEGKYKLWIGNISDEIKEHNKGTFQEIWNTSIETHFKESFLTKNELEELKQIGKNISNADAVNLFLAHLKIFIQNTREEEKTKKKLYQSMGIMAGIFLAIVLI